MKAKRKIYDEREDAILLAIKRAKKPIQSEQLYEVVHSFFSNKRQFTGMMGGMTKSKRVVTARDGKYRFYSLLESDSEPDSVTTSAPSEPTPRIDQLFTRRAAAMHASMQARKVKPMMWNNPEKEGR